MFQYMHHIGVIPLSGTKSVTHMVEDAAALASDTLSIALTVDEVQAMTHFLNGL